MAGNLYNNFYRLFTFLSILCAFLNLGGLWGCAGSTGLQNAPLSSTSSGPEISTNPTANPTANPAASPPGEILGSTPEAGSITPQFYRTHSFVFSHEKNGSFVVTSVIPKIGAPLFDSGKVKRLVYDPSGEGEYKEEKCLGCEGQIVRVVDCGSSWKEDTKNLIESLPPEEQMNGLDGSVAFFIFIGNPPYAKKICPAPRYQDFVISALDSTVSLKSLNVSMESMLLFTLLPKYPDFQKFGEGSLGGLKPFASYDQFLSLNKDAFFLRGAYVHLLSYLDFSPTPSP